MGPDKSPGPDGMTARFLQKYWAQVGGITVEEIQKVFRGGRPPEEWMKSNIVLIPKVDDPDSPNQYRPLTIGNILYRLLMKLVATRLQKHVKVLISNTQTTFVKGRCISDNTILVREVIHSFNSQKYKEKSFLLKVDINKAFDTVRWEFIWEAMAKVNIPQPLIALVRNCMRASQVTILFNGTGQGFIKPTRGLRQGCPLSPFLFILAMESLTRELQWAVQHGDIKGVKLARTAPKITHIMYADDLVLFGNAEIEEVRHLKQVLERFGHYSGLVVNPDKSKIWFSKACPEALQQQLLGEI